jgi:uncharacterized protein DUF2752
MTKPGKKLILKRTYSVPEQLTMLGAGAAAAGAAYPLIVGHTSLRGLPCPLRTLTGVPCPFCGLTTATVELTHGDLAAAARANPLVYIAAAAALGTAPILIARAFGKAAPPRPMSARNRRRLAAAGIALSIGSWAYQLHRANLI